MLRLDPRTRIEAPAPILNSFAAAARAGWPVLLAALLLVPGGAGAQRGRRLAPPNLAPRMQPAPAPPARVPPLGMGLDELRQLPPQQRLQRLRDDPGFQSLPPQKQRQMIESLRRLNAMPPAQQQRLVNRMRQLGELSPRQRAGLEHLFSQFRSMPPNRRRAFRGAYHRLRSLPSAEREQRLASPVLQQRFSPAEMQSLRQALSLDLPADLVGGGPSRRPPDF